MSQASSPSCTGTSSIPPTWFEFLNPTSVHGFVQTQAVLVEPLLLGPIILAFGSSVLHSVGFSEILPALGIPGVSTFEGLCYMGFEKARFITASVLDLPSDIMYLHFSEQMFGHKAAGFRSCCLSAGDVNLNRAAHNSAVSNFWRSLRTETGYLRGFPVFFTRS
jgi:hypothetical protein